jgi:hypothetical protein
MRERSATTLALARQGCKARWLRSIINVALARACNACRGRGRLCPHTPKPSAGTHRLDALRAPKVHNSDLQLRLGAGRLLQQKVAGLYVLHGTPAVSHQNSTHPTHQRQSTDHRVRTNRPPTAAAGSAHRVQDALPVALLQHLQHVMRYARSIGLRQRAPRLVGTPGSQLQDKVRNCPLPAPRKISQQGKPSAYYSTHSGLSKVLSMQVPHSGLHGTVLTGYKTTNFLRAPPGAAPSRRPCTAL